MEENGIYAHKPEVCVENILSGSDKDIAFEESSLDNYLMRAIDHILDSRYAELSVSAFIFSTGSKDNNGNKYTLFPRGRGICDKTTHRYCCTDCKKHYRGYNLFNLPKQYYIYRLEKIII